MSTDRQKAINLLIIGICLAPLVWLFIYLWTFNYVKEENIEPAGTPKPSGPLANVQPESGAILYGHIRLEDARIKSGRKVEPSQPLTAELLIENRTTAVCRLLYTPWPSVLFDARLFYLGPDGKGREQLYAAANTSGAGLPSAGNYRFKPSRHFITEVLSGQSMSVPLALQPSFDLSRPGKYRLQVTYDPAKYADAEPLNLEALKVVTQALEFKPLDFEIPGAPAAALPAAPAAPKTSDNP